MSQAGTGRAQLRRLQACGARVALLPALRDVDTFADARHVAALAPGSRFAQTFRGLAAPAGAVEGAVDDSVVESVRA
jgi:hypothetical protein